MKTAYLTIFASFLVASPAIAAWTLDNANSQVSFVSVKAGDAGEAHRFRQLAGRISEDGKASLVIQLASVDTMIPIRDDRMREILFETDIFPTATLGANIDMERLDSLEPGESMDMSVNLKLDLHGQQVELPAEMVVARLGHDKLLVSSRKPIIVNAANVDLAEGVEALREVANLPSISKAVPVSFVLTFEED